MPNYNSFRRFSLDPANEGEVLEKAIQRAYSSSGGKLNAFNAGSPLLVLLESLVFSHMEFLYWLNSMPEAMVLTYIAEILGEGRNYGSKATVTLQVTLTKVLTSDFILSAGTRVYSKNNNNIAYRLQNNFIIPPGQLTGFVTAEADKVGIEYQVLANELEVLGENFAYLLSITNPAASTLGSDFETLDEMAERVQAIMSQTTPVSTLDWLNVIEKYYPGKLAEVKNADGILYLYIEDYTVNPIFEQYCQSVKGLLQTIEFKPYLKALLQLRITPAEPFTEQTCLEITQALSAYLKKAKPLQPIDLYDKMLDVVAANTDLNGFDVLYYYSGLEQGTRQSIPFSTYDYIGGQLVKETFTNNYYLVNSSFNVVLSAFDEAELGYLSYHAVYTNLGPGVYSSGDIVLISGTYYLITTSGNFDPLTTTNWVILSAPQTWTNNLLVTAADWLIESTTIPGLSHGFIPAFTYTTAPLVDSYLSAITPTAKATGQSVLPGEYFYIPGFDEIIYYNNTTVSYIVDPLAPAAQAEVFVKPNPFYSKLTRRSRYSIGHITNDNNFIYISTQGATVPIATGLVIPATVIYPAPGFGTLISSNDVIYEVLQAFIPLAGDTIQSLLTAGFIKKAYRKYEDFEYIIPGFRAPYFFSIDYILFDQEPDVVVSLDNSGTYTIS
jgi:hypothetical protein